MSSEWTHSTTLQMKSERRNQLEQLQFKLQVLEGRRIELREVADKTLEVGLTVLGISSLPKEGMPPARLFETYFSGNYSARKRVCLLSRRSTPKWRSPASGTAIGTRARLCSSRNGPRHARPG